MSGWVSAVINSNSAFSLQPFLPLFAGDQHACGCLWSENRRPTALLPVASYLLMFPKAISGPITRFQMIASQIKERIPCLSQTAAGIRRFMLGFAKKALIADQLALITSREIFSQSPLRLPAGLAWLATPLLYAADLFRFFRLYGYGSRAGAGLGISSLARTSIILIFPKALQNSGAGGTFPFPSGFAIMSFTPGVKTPFNYMAQAALEYPDRFFAHRVVAWRYPSLHCLGAFAGCRPYSGRRFFWRLVEKVVAPAAAPLRTRCHHAGLGASSGRQPCCLPGITLKRWWVFQDLPPG